MQMITYLDINNFLGYRKYEQLKFLRERHTFSTEHIYKLFMMIWASENLWEALYSHNM